MDEFDAEEAMVSAVGKSGDSLVGDRLEVEDRDWLWEEE